MESLGKPREGCPLRGVGGLAGLLEAERSDDHLLVKTAGEQGECR